VVENSAGSDSTELEVVDCKIRPSGLYLVVVVSGGQAKTLFNQNDEPIEWQIIDANGNVLNKLIRTYDENGRVTELRYTMENVLLSLPAEAREEISAQPGAAEELAKQFAAFFGEQRNFMRTTYKYDANGRLTEKHTYMGPSMETVTKIAYNDHSDKSEEQTITIGDPNDPGKEPSRESPPPALPPSHTSETAIPTNTITLEIGQSRPLLHQPAPITRL
jgi:YD repeat-containing protein